MITPHFQESIGRVLLGQSTKSASVPFPKPLGVFEVHREPKARPARCSAYEGSLLEHQYSALLVNHDGLDREQEALKAEEAHIHADVLRLAAPVHEDLLDHADLLL